MLHHFWDLIIFVLNKHIPVPLHNKMHWTFLTAEVHNGSEGIAGTKITLSRTPEFKSCLYNLLAVNLGGYYLNTLS